MSCGTIAPQSFPGPPWNPHVIYHLATGGKGRRRKAIVQLVFSTGKSIVKYRSAKINTWTTPRLLSLRSADSPPVLNSDHTLLSTRFYAIYPKNIISKSSVDFLKPLGESCRS